MRGFGAQASFFVLFCTCLAAVGAQAQTTGLEDLVGARGGQAEGELQRRGYGYIRGEKSGGRSYTFWWSEDRRQCVTIATVDGRYASIRATLPPDCRKPGNLRPPYGGGQNRPDEDDGPIVDGRNVELGLVCFGDGSKDGIATGSTWTWNRERNRYEYGTYTASRTQVFDASLMLQTWAGGGRIRLPRSLVPPIHSGGQDGWWDLYDVAVSPDAIRATYRLNGLNKPRVTIDRRSGRITVQGLSDYGFRGSCDTIGRQRRKF